MPELIYDIGRYLITGCGPWTGGSRYQPFVVLAHHTRLEKIPINHQPKLSIPSTVKKQKQNKNKTKKSFSCCRRLSSKYMAFGRL
jgi:hypothetical protein